ncbi:hypothetical protein RCL1_009004 [Eukaryota sp. TZLM3-RCL]
MAPKAKKVSNDEGAEKVIQYISSNNRPFGAQNIVDGLAGTISITQMKKILSELADTGRITTQPYGKTNIYIPLQNADEAPSEAELAELDVQIKSLRQQISELQEEISTIQAECKTLEAEPNDQQLVPKIEELRNKTKKMSENLSELTEGGKLVDPETRSRVLSEYQSAIKQWSKRRSCCLNVIATIADGIGVKPREVVESTGLETDSDVEMLPPTKRKRFN